MLLFTFTISFATDTPYSDPATTLITNLTFDNKKPHNSFIPGIRTSDNHAYHQMHTGYYAHFTPADFQRMFTDAVNELLGGSN